VASFQVTFDANDPARLAEFWALALGYVIQSPPADFESWDDWARSMEIPEENWNDARALVDPTGDGPRIFFQRVPEGKAAKNRVHLDVNASTGPSDEDKRAKVEELATVLVEAGAVMQRSYEEQGGFWIVMLDPEGNEFCVQ
jgi:hypothetical protein